MRRTRHFQMTGKTGPKDYYKGTRSGSMGSHTKHGGYTVDFDKVRTYVVPENLSTFKVNIRVHSRATASMYKKRLTGRIS